MVCRIKVPMLPVVTSQYARRFGLVFEPNDLIPMLLALKHSPSKRKSIAKPVKPQEEVDTPGEVYNQTLE